jgi:tetratricopeptide (TPR) repeat protein
MTLGNNGPRSTVAKAAKLRAGGELHEAERLLDTALKQSTLEDSERALLLTEAAQVALRKGNWPAAKTLLDEALGLVSVTGDLGEFSTWATASERKAWLLFREGKLPQSRIVAESLLFELQRQNDNDPKLLAGIHNTLGGIAWHEGRHEVAFGHTRQSAELFREAHDASGAANAFANLGVLEYARGDWAQATRDFLESERIRTENGIVEGRATVVFNLGVIDMVAGDYDAARRRFNDGLNLARQTGETYECGRIAMTLAHLSVLEQRFEEAHRLLQDVASSESMSDDDRLQASWLNALVECNRGAPEQAIAIASLARDTAKRWGLTEAELDSCRALGTSYRRAGRYAEAEQVLLEAVQLADKLGDSYRRAMVLLELGTVRTEAQKDPNACLDEASAAFEQLGADANVKRARALRSH